MSCAHMGLDKGGVRWLYTINFIVGGVISVLITAAINKLAYDNAAILMRRH